MSVSALKIVKIFNFFKVIGLTTKQPKVKYFGNKRHYFAKPLEGEILARVKSLK